MKLPEGRCTHMGFVRHDEKVFSHVLNLDDDNTYFFDEDDCPDPEVLMIVTHEGYVHFGDKKYRYRIRTDTDGDWVAHCDDEHQYYILDTKKSDIYDTEKSLFMHLLEKNLVK